METWTKSHGTCFFRLGHVAKDRVGDWRLFHWSIVVPAGFIADKAQSPEVNKVLIMMMSIIPSAFGILSVILVMFYMLNEKKMKIIASELEARRKAGGQADATV